MFPYTTEYRPIINKGQLKFLANINFLFKILWYFVILQSTMHPLQCLHFIWIATNVFLFSFGQKKWTVLTWVLIIIYQKKKKKWVHHILLVLSFQNPCIPSKVLLYYYQLDRQFFWSLPYLHMKGFHLTCGLFVQTQGCATPTHHMLGLMLCAALKFTHTPFIINTQWKTTCKFRSEQTRAPP